MHLYQALNIPRESVSLRQRSSGRHFTSPRYHNKPSTISVSSLKPTKGTPGVPKGLILNLVTEFFFASLPNFSRPLCIDSFFDLCTATADTSQPPRPKLKNLRGSHYEVSFEVVLLLGLGIKINTTISSFGCSVLNPDQPLFIRKFGENPDSKNNHHHRRHCSFKPPSPRHHLSNTQPGSMDETSTSPSPSRDLQERAESERVRVGLKKAIKRRKRLDARQKEFEKRPKVKFQDLLRARKERSLHTKSDGRDANRVGRGVDVVEISDEGEEFEEVRKEEVGCGEAEATSGDDEVPKAARDVKVRKSVEVKSADGTIVVRLGECVPFSYSSCSSTTNGLVVHARVARRLEPSASSRGLLETRFVWDARLGRRSVPSRASSTGWSLLGN